MEVSESTRVGYKAFVPLQPGVVLVLLKSALSDSERKSGDEVSSEASGNSENKTRRDITGLYIIYIFLRTPNGSKPKSSVL